MNESHELDRRIGGGVEPAVMPEDSCPTCHEDRMDFLIFLDDDGEFVTCTTCGEVFVL